MVDLKKSIQLRRFHVALLSALVVIALVILLGYYNMIMASSEEVTFNATLLNIKNMMFVQNIVSKDRDKSCVFLNNVDLFDKVDVIGKRKYDKNSISLWEYDSRNHILTYHVRGTQFFRAIPDKVITIHLVCNDGLVLFNVNDYMWCKNKSWWGCEKW